jgi:hypothetical protein
LANDALSMAKAHLMEFDKPRIAADINKHDKNFFHIHDAIPFRASA